MLTFSFGMAKLCSSCIVFNGGMAADAAGSIATVFEWTWVAGARDLSVVVATEVIIGTWRGSLRIDMIILGGRCLGSEDEDPGETVGSGGVWTLDS